MLGQKKQTANFIDNSSRLYKSSHMGLINENNKTTVINIYHPETRNFRGWQPSFQSATTVLVFRKCNTWLSGSCTLEITIAVHMINKRLYVKKFCLPRVRLLCALEYIADKLLPKLNVQLGPHPIHMFNGMLLQGPDTKPHHEIRGLLEKYPTVFFYANT